MAELLKALEARLTSLTPPSSSTPTIPGIVLLSTASQPNSTPHIFSTGIASVSASRVPAPALTPNSTMWFASATKLLTSIAVLQLVERGLWDLDRPIAEALPELGRLREVQDFDDSEQPVYAEDTDGKPAGARATLRHLLTHTSGQAYDFLNPKVMRWWKALSASSGGRDMRAEASGTVIAGYGGALVREPGVEWEYGPGVDWAGALVEKIYGEERGRLGRSVQREVLDKVGVEARDVVWRRGDCTWGEEEMGQRWVDLTVRTMDGLKYFPPLPPEMARDDLGGAGVRMAPAAYFAVLESLVKNDGRLLKPETVREYAFTPQLVDEEGKLGTKLAASMRAAFLTQPGGRMMSGGLPIPSAEGEARDEYEYNHSLLGALSRRKGHKHWALHWGGAPNIQWVIEPEHGVAGLFAAQVMPPADPEMLDLAVEFREAVVETMKS